MSTVFALECPPVATWCYMVTNPESGTAYVVDAPYQSAGVLIDEAKRIGVRITDIFLTHTHWDHTADCATLQRATGARVVVHEADRYRLVDPMNHTIWPLPFTIDPVDEVECITHVTSTVTPYGGTGSLRVLHTPGHTEGGVCFVDDQTRRVFAGDTLFAASVGRVDLPGGDEVTLLRSIREVLFQLDVSYTVYPGHGPTTTIGTERRSNPFVGDAA
jgi:glyoxylase-like metal-dependent hydrolase (beta-lactamase superfamily II)